MDLPTPTPPPPISGYRSRAINPAVDFAAAMRPVAGPGARVADGPGGKIISVDPRVLARRALPWSVRVVPVAAAAPSHVEWRVAVYAGLVLAHGAILSPPVVPDGVDPETGLAYYYAPARSSSTESWLSVLDDGAGNWELIWRDAPTGGSYGARWRAIAEMIADTPPVMRQLECGVIVLDGDGGDGAGDLLPFDLAVIDGDPCIYLPTDPDDLVYVRGISTYATRDASAVPAPGAGGWVQLSPGSGQSSVVRVWAWAIWSEHYADYRWGVSTTDPLNNPSATNRYIASVEIGKFAHDDEAGEYTVAAQYCHGSLIVADDQGDDLSVGRDGYNQSISLRNFQRGGHTQTSWDSVDFVVREARSGEHPDQPYILDYVNGGTIWSGVQGMIQTAIEELLRELIGRFGGSGGTPADLVTVLDGRYQPVCTESGPSYGLGMGQWVLAVP